ncbi:hypothetical protein CLHUN_02280 [Ruminiclostridium hungatei]|uniref:Uncharacterized protein n=1 Tax=Ruminiclostridium hungatei TaxID=48256 RepID=A0A1V4SRB8_RUMHU|nr:hypothetical protein CLHUN_02280 [Ruminiclostridium hungatei]
MFKDLVARKPKKIKIICKKCDSECLIIEQALMEQGYLVTDKRTILRCESCKREE